MGAPQPYYGYPPQAAPGGMAMPIAITKRLVFVIIALGFFLAWVALLARGLGYPLDPSGHKAVYALGLVGVLFGFGGAALGALGSHRTDGYQNLGLLLLAAFFLAALTAVPF